MVQHKSRTLCGQQCAESCLQRTFSKTSKHKQNAAALTMYK